MHFSAFICRTGVLALGSAQLCEPFASDQSIPSFFAGTAVCHMVRARGAVQAVKCGFSTCLGFVSVGHVSRFAHRRAFVDRSVQKTL
eukprot:818932-Alexandrium_andersonii.AAC.1